MPYNKDLRPVDTTLFLNKLSVLMERLKTQYADGTFKTQTDVIDEFNRLIGVFYGSLSTPFLQTREVLEGTPPSYEVFNESFEELGWDLKVLFLELATLEETILGNFNYMVTERDKLTKILKRISSKVGDYILYSSDPIGNAFYFKDSYNDASKIDFGSSLLTATQCEIHQDEGIVTLPITASAKSKVSMQVKINEDTSNGVVGNNQELGKAPHNDLRDILDSNPDTWFEYERVQAKLLDDTEPLKLTMTLYSAKPQVVNYVKINPNNFGAQTPVYIVAIDTSFDGSQWVSVKDEIPISDFLQEDEENVFTLAPSTSKFSGQGLYSFTPRKVKYVRVRFEQSTPYEINTPAGYRWRYAIGIRDLEAHAIKYEKEGDIISTAFVAPSEIQKVTVLASENPTEESVLADITHQLSPDDGAVWYDIQPQDRSGQDTPEILSFNTGLEGSIQTERPVISLRHRMVIKRDKEQFEEGVAVLRTAEKLTSDLLTIPQISPPTLNMSRLPVPGTTALFNPLWGSRAHDGFFIIDDVESWKITRPIPQKVGRSTGETGMTLQMPISEFIQDGRVDLDEILIWVDGDTGWERVGSFSAANTTDKVYTISTDGVIQFGSGDPASPAGYVPNSGAIIGFTLKAERLQPSPSSPYRCDLKLSTDGDKKNIHIYRRGLGDSDSGFTSAPTLTFKSAATVHRTPHRFLENTPNFINGAGVFDVRWTFIDGSEELTTAGDYSIDLRRGIIYSFTPTPDSGSPVRFQYRYTPWIRVTDDQWDFDPQSEDFSSIVLKDNAYLTRRTSISLTPYVSKRVVLLGQSNIVPKSIRFPDAMFESGEPPFELAYIDGVSEFKAASIDGPDLRGRFSVDYEKGVLYVSQSDTVAVVDPGRLGFNFADYVITYNVARKLGSEEYDIDEANGIITLDTNTMLQVWGREDVDATRNSLLKVVYKYVVMTRESIKDLEPYFSPIVRDVVIKALPKGAS